MSLVLVLACLWVIAATLTAFLPMRLQVWPGLPLLLTAPVLIVMLGLEYGAWLALVGCLAFASMFRRPLLHVASRLRQRLRG